MGSPPMPTQSGLPDAARRQLRHRLVGQGAATRDHADASGLVNVARHDTHLGFARRNDARAIGADQGGAFAGHVAPYRHHVEDRNAVGDADDQADAGVHRLADGVGSERRRHENDAGVGAGVGHGAGHRVEQRPPQGRAAAAARIDAADVARAVIHRLLGVKPPPRAPCPAPAGGCFRPPECSWFVLRNEAPPLEGGVGKGGMDDLRTPCPRRPPCRRPPGNSAPIPRTAAGLLRRWCPRYERSRELLPPPWTPRAARPRRTRRSAECRRRR